MHPFDLYPGDGETVLPKIGATNTRHGDAPRLMRLTRQRSCAYCEVDLVGDYYRWLLISLDHVLPARQCQGLGIPEELYNSFSNIVLCCSGCNGFDNRYRIPPDAAAGGWTLQRFTSLRDRVFRDRKARILKRGEDELEFYHRRPWIPSCG